MRTATSRGFSTIYLAIIVAVLVLGAGGYAYMYINQKNRSTDDALLLAQLALNQPERQQLIAEIIDARTAAADQIQRLKTIQGRGNASVSATLKTAWLSARGALTVNATAFVNTAAPVAASPKLTEAIKDLNQKKEQIALKLQALEALVTSPTVSTPANIAQTQTYLAEVKKYLEELKKVAEGLTPSSSGLSPTEIDTYQEAVAQILNDITESSAAINTAVNTSGSNSSTNTNTNTSNTNSGNTTSSSGDTPGGSTPASGQSSSNDSGDEPGITPQEQAIIDVQNQIINLENQLTQNPTGQTSGTSGGQGSSSNNGNDIDDSASWQTAPSGQSGSNSDDLPKLIQGSNDF